jgi:uncharacterized protein (DUF433 family)
MLSRPSEYKHIMLDPDGAAVIDGTTMKVKELVLEHVAYGWSAEQLHREHPYLMLSQVHAALAYYFDHQSQLDLEIEQDLKMVEEMSEAWQVQNDAIHQKLRDSRRSC